MATGEVQGEVHGHTRRIYNYSTAIGQVVSAPFPRGKSLMQDAIEPAGVVEVQPIKMPVTRFMLRHVQQVPDSGANASPGSKITVTMSQSPGTAYLPYLGLSYTLNDTNSSSITGTGFCNGAWNVVKAMRLYIDDQIIEHSEDSNVWHTWVHGSKRTDLAPGMANSIPINFEPQINEYPSLGIFKTGGRAFNATDAETYSASRVFIIDNPLTRLRHAIPTNFFNKEIRIEFELAQSADINFAAASGNAANVLPAFSLTNIRFLYYNVSGYTQGTISRYKSSGFCGGLSYISRQSRPWDATGDFNTQINESTSCLNGITMIPLQTTSPNIHENKLANYVTGTRNLYDSLQFKIAGKNYPQQPLNLSGNQVAEAYFQLLALTQIGFQCNGNLYQGGYYGIRELGPIPFSFGVHGGYEGDYVADGISTLGGRNDIRIELNRGSGAGIATTWKIFIQKTGLLKLDSTQVVWTN